MDSCRGSIQLKRSHRLFQKLITEAATGLSFSPDTLEDLTPGKTSYNQADFQQLFKPSGVLKPRKPKERTLCRPAPRPPGRFTGVLPLEKSEDQALPRQQTVYIAQGSQSRTRPTAAKKDKPAHMATRRNQEQNFLNQMVKYQKNLQGLSGSEKMATHPSKSLKTDLSVPEDSTAASRPPTDAAGAVGWLAAQCSAHGGDQHHRVIQRLIAQLCEADQQEDPQEDPDPPLDAQLVVPLLSFLSSQTTLVRSLLAEQLNSSEWRTRLVSCNTLRCLKGPINKDVVHKLLHLMLNDHSNPVRRAAAETLMKLGRIQQVHTELRLKLQEGRGLRGRMEALDVICHLKIKTETLQEPVIGCLSDEFTALRKQACVTAASMQLRGERVVSCLLQLVEHDAAPDVRLSAIRAVGALGLSSPDLQEALMHCVETEREAELRAEACRMLQSSGVSSDRLQGFLLQRVHLECNPLVQRTMKEVLQLCDGSRQEYEHSQYISLQVKRLCDWRVITEKLELLEKLTAEGESLKPRMLVRLLSQRYAIQHNKAD
ncbi:HEAT repeat-containing protein 4 [Pseudochaenichthys georgianus]|uniref:HEAT repeat-containing protein 4 n=1 Tax=Pseudochaenichthys georgianus TaxID=52239 RepID=UPI00146B9E17|nr:HEAT repeat-containing protein 4 [Pseudochaenichthys georgianus]XP_033935725.1 HEAT repeat-containing protein 4 [Pseudochaenichthys georgianus]